jgi:predicted transcriptional regulator of viral defense system
VWVDELSRVFITDRERTVLDAFVSPGLFGSIGEVLDILKEHLSELDVKRLVSYALRYGQDATIKRLGYALEQLGADPGAIRPLRRAPIRGYRLFDPQGPDRGPAIAGWHLRDNLGASARMVDVKPDRLTTSTGRVEPHRSPPFGPGSGAVAVILASSPRDTPR